MTDSDSVMRGREFRAAAHALSVECRYSSPYNQWQNGIVERMIKQIMERVLALLDRSQLSNDFWYSAVSYAAHTINGTPTQVNPKSASPRNVWRGNLRRCNGEWVLPESDKLDESFRRTFGSDAYVRVDGRNKLDSRCQKCVFLGYAEDHADGVYEFINDATGRRIISRDAVFDERSVLPNSCHSWVCAEGTRTLPPWMSFNPFQVSDPVLGPFAVNNTGPNTEVKQVAHVSDSPSDANATARSGSVTDEVSFTQAMWKEASVLPRSPLTIKQSQNKHILRQGIVRQSAKDIKSLSGWRVARLQLIHALQLPAAKLIGRVMPSGDSRSRPYTVTDLGLSLIHI